MIRKLAILMLACLAVSILVIGIASFWAYVTIGGGSILITHYYTVAADDQRPPMSWSYGGFLLGVGWVMDKEGGRADSLSFPFWAPCVLLLTYPTIAFICGPYRRSRRRRKSLCLKCGYDLRGNVSGICPECGEKI